MELLDSKEPCGFVALSISSIHYPGSSTVGHEAAYLIEGFWKRYYPTELTSQKYTPDVEGIKRWYQAWGHFKKLAQQAHERGQTIHLETNRTSLAVSSRTWTTITEAGLPPEVARASAAFKRGWQERYPEDYAVSRTLLSWIKTGMKEQEVQRLLGSPDVESDGGWCYILFYSMFIEVRFSAEGTVVQVTSPLLPTKAEPSGAVDKNQLIHSVKNRTSLAVNQTAVFHLVQTQVRDGYSPGVPLESLTVYVLVFPDRSPQVFKLFGSKSMEEAIGDLPRGSVLQYDGNPFAKAPPPAQIEALTALCKSRGISFILGPIN
jgi:hypothetical protein